MPRFLKASAASGAVRNLTSALAASGCLALGGDAAREDRHLLDVGRQRADIIDAGEMRHLADLLDADLDFAAGDDGADEDAGRRLLELRLDLVGDAETLEQAMT